MEENIEKEEIDETNSTGSEESKKDNSGKWKEFKKFRNAKKVPKLLHSLVVPSPLNPNPPKQFMNPPPSPELVADKQDPNCFFGNGVNFKAKLIGIKEVGQARGDRLAQEALMELKANVKLSNTHKQKIVFNISVDGIKIKDDKGQNVLHHHPVHKISFIAQDISDNRAFGYVFGSPALGHNFFAIKTEKTAQQVVVAMRDLFQVVFNIRKKEMKENGVANAQPNAIEAQDENISNSNEADVEKESPRGSDDNANLQEDANLNGMDNAPDLLDLDAEMQEPRKSFNGEDDFFSNPDSNDPFFSDPLTFISSISSSMSTNPGGSYLTVNVSCANESNFTPIAPAEETSPAFNVNFDNLPHSTPNDQSIAISNEFTFNTFTPVTPEDTSASFNATFDSLPNDSSFQSPPSTNPFETNDRYAPLANLSRSLFSDSFTDTSAKTETEVESTSQQSSDNQQSSKINLSPDIFSDLDPLGKDRPFIDKKDFFHEVKNPPKKVLSDLVQASQRSASPPSSDSNCSVASVGSPPLSASPNPFTAAFSSVEPSSSGTSSPLANSDLGSSDSFLSKSNGRNPYFDDEFNYPSPINPPPPLIIPPLPPRPLTGFPPPLPPKIQTSTIKIDPPIAMKNGDNCKMERPVGTLPIPIPPRRVRGPVPRLGNSPRPAPGDRYANIPEENSFTSVSSLTDSSKGLSVPMSTSDGSWASPSRNGFAPSPVFPPPPPPNSLNGTVNNRCRLTVSVVNNNLEKVDNRMTSHKENFTDFETAWIMAKPTDKSIFHRSSDPFADEFFTSMANEKNSSIESRNKFNQNTGWPTDSFIVNRQR